jgi:hypothetical protein
MNEMTGSSGDQIITEYRNDINKGAVIARLHGKKEINSIK